VGATAVGKSAVAIALARRTQGEVVAMDAFTVYRGMAVLSAAPRPPPDVPHHLLGILDPSEHGSAALFVERAAAAIAEIRGRGRTPWLAGGTALYLKAYAKGLSAAVPRDPALRLALADLLDREGPEALHRRLAASDPARAAELHRNDVRRVVRALEIVAATGGRASALRASWAAPDVRPVRILGLRREPADLARRIEARVRAQFENGVLEEARALLGRPLSPEAGKVLGLDVLAEVLAGRLDEALARDELVRRTRRFARKQATFFRSFDVRWTEVPAGEPPDETAERILGQEAATSS
jgi:tRNA dimethylallyltransferase